MVIDYFAVLPSGKKGALEPHCLTQGTWYQRINEELFRAIHYGAGIIRIRDKGAELRIPIEFGFGYVLQYLRQFTEAERQEGRKRHVLQRQLDWIGRGLPIELKRRGAKIEMWADDVHRLHRESFLRAIEKADHFVS
ncbi:hypothetical protein QNN95_14000 [Exiguobacterium acetylicum]|uniref:hypothetical protein n=1 Tax=Exiguobacterium acetylicum TaxID=41170 RepID=UPI0035A69E30